MPFVEISVILILFIAFLGESLFGFGGGLIAIPLLSLILGVKEAVSLLLIFQFMMGLMVIPVVRDRSRRYTRPMLIGAVTGTAVGVAGLHGFDEGALRMVLALFILVYLARALLRPSSSENAVGRRRWSLASGGVGGFFHGLIGTGGPALLMYLNEVVDDRVQLRATMIVLLCACNVVRMAASVPLGLLTPSVLTRALPALPFFLVAVYTGHRWHHHLDERRYRQIILVLLTLSCLTLLIRSLH